MRASVQGFTRRYTVVAGGGCLVLFSASMVFPRRIFFPTGFAVNGSSVFQTFRETYHALLPPAVGCAACGLTSPLYVCV